MSDDADPVADQIREWAAARQRVTDLVGSLTDDELARTVPACPDWSVRDLLSHMVGLGADVLDGDEPDDHNPDWTGAQVEARRDRSADQLLAEWAALAHDLEAWMRDHGARPLGDAVIHEQDIRGAVGRPGGTDSVGFALIRDRMADRFGKAVGDAGLPPIALVGDTWSWCSADDVDPVDALVRLRASDADLGRALTARRTAAQLASWTETGDVTPYLDAFATVGELPDQPLSE